jgi:hypothetical protein
MRLCPFDPHAFAAHHLFKTCARVGVTGLTFHDLRGSAVVRLALAEATVPQIATFTGHSLKDVEAILDAHYLGRDIQLAEAAALKLEQRKNCKTRLAFASAKSLSP